MVVSVMKKRKVLSRKRSVINPGFDRLHLSCGHFKLIASGSEPVKVTSCPQCTL